MSIPQTATAYPIHGDHIPPHHHHHHLHNPRGLSHIAVAAAAAIGVPPPRGLGQAKTQAYPSNPSNASSNASSNTTGATTTTAAAASSSSSSSAAAGTGAQGSSSSSSSRAGEDGMYGHGATAHLVANFITALFNCPSIPPTPSSSSSSTSSSSSSPPPSSSNSSSQQATAPPLANFVAYALHRTRLHPCVTFTALFLLSRLKSRFPNARGSSGHRLFISAFMIASKVVCDDTYSNKSWCVVGQNMFSLREVNQMEREMCGYLEWSLCVDPEELEKFESKVREDYTAVVVPTAKKPLPTVTTTIPTTALGRPVLTPINTSLPPSHPRTHLPPAPLSSTGATVAPSPTSSVSSATSGITQLTAATAHTARQMLPTPPASPGDPSHSAGPSPASSTVCLTPPSGDDISGAGVVSAPTPNGVVHVHHQQHPHLEKHQQQQQVVQAQRSFGAVPQHHQQHAGVVQRAGSFVAGAVSVW